MGNPLIIVGPQASGKTKNADSFLHVFGCTRIVDNWNGVTPLMGGDLALTNAENFQVPKGCRVMSVVEALKQAKAA